MHEQLIAETGQPVLVSEHDTGHIACQDRIDQFQKLLALKIETSANLVDPLIYPNALLLAG